MNEKERKILDLFKKYAFQVIKEPKDKLKYHYLEPGLAYHDTMWDWDSYYEIYSLSHILELLKDDSDFDYDYNRKLLNAAAKGTVLNFLDFMEEDGFTPIMIRTNIYNDDYASKENVGNSNKGFLIKTALLASVLNDDYEWIDCEKLERYLKYLKKNQFDEKSGLYYFKTDIMIGIDNNPTVFGRPNGSSADILFNSNMVDEFDSLIKIYEKLGMDYSFYQKEKENLISSINKEMWDERDGLYYSQDILVKTNKTDIFNHGLSAFWNTLPIKVEFIGCYMPLVYSFVDEERRDRMIKRLSKDALISEYGVRTLSKYEKMYNLEPSGNPSNWLGAIWGLSNYIAFMAFYNNGNMDKAKDVYEKTVDLYSNGIDKIGSLSESYNPETGDGILHDMFFSFNMLVSSMMITLSKK